MASVSEHVVPPSLPVVGKAFPFIKIARINSVRRILLEMFFQPLYCRLFSLKIAEPSIDTKLDEMSFFILAYFLTDLLVKAPKYSVPWIPQPFWRVWEVEIQA